MAVLLAVTGRMPTQPAGGDFNDSQGFEETVILVMKETRQ